MDLVIYLDFFIVVLLEALAWSLAVVIVLGVVAVCLHLMLRPLFGSDR